MVISRENVMKKIKEEVAHAEQHMHTDQFPLYISKLHVLCELVLDQSSTLEDKERMTMSKSQASIPEPSKSQEEENPELLKGDSIFDF